MSYYSTEQSKINFVPNTSDSEFMIFETLEPRPSFMYTTPKILAPVHCFDYQIHAFDIEILKEEWKDESYTKPRDFISLKMNELEKTGYLTDRLVEVCSAKLERSALPGQFILSYCNISRKNLVNIDILRYHQHLQYLNLCRNELYSLSALSYLHFLKYLDVSHNIISDLLDFKPPLNLIYVNFSHNTIEKLPDLTDFWSLVYLDVSHNDISVIEGLKNLKYLNYLDLSYNAIKCLSNLPERNLERLCIDHNLISNYTDDIFGVYSLVHVSVAHNRLSSLKMFERMTQLETLNLQKNDIVDLIELASFKKLSHLHKLTLKGNPICKRTKYREICIYLAPCLKVLDEEVIEVNEKGFVDYLYTNSMVRDAGYDHAMMEILYQLNVPTINSSVVPGYQNLASIIVLVGPSGSKKKAVIMNLVEKFPKFLRVGISYTTRPRCDHEVDGKDYFFVSDETYEQLLHDGKLLCSTLKYGHHFGIGYDEFSKISEQAGILIFNCDVTCALQIRSKFLNCKLILALPKDPEVHRNWLRDKFSCAPWMASYINAFILKYKSMKRSKIEDFEMQFCASIVEDLLKFLDQPSPGETKIENEQEESNHFDLEEDEEESIYAHEEKLPGEEPKVIIDDLEEIYCPKSVNTLGSMSKSLTQTEASKMIPILRTSTERSMNSSFSVSFSSMSTEPNQSSLERQKQIEETSKCENIEATGSSSSTKKKICFVDDKNEDKKGPQYIADAMAPSISEINDMLVTSEYFKKTGASSLVGKNARAYFEYLICAEKSNQNFTDDCEVCMDFFMEEQMQKRDVYLQMYLFNPGLYFAIIYTDDFDEAIQKMHSVLKTCVEMQRKYHDEEPKVVQHGSCPEILDAKIKQLYAMLK